MLGVVLLLRIALVSRGLVRRNVRYLYGCEMVVHMLMKSWHVYIPYLDRSCLFASWRAVLMH